MLWVTARQLKSRNPAARRRAAETLGRDGGRRVIRLLSAALEDEDAEVRRLAAAGLGKQGSPECLQPLLKALSDRESAVVQTAVVALKPFSDSRQVHLALANLLRHEDAGARGQAAQVLEHLGWRPDGPEEEVWFLMAKGLFSRAAALGAVAVPALETALFSHASSVAAAAADALAQISDPRVPALFASALKEGDPAVCVAAVDALQRLGDPRFAEPIIGLLRHANPRVRAAAVEALGRLRITEAVEPLRTLLTDPAWEVRREAAEALGRLQDARAVRTLNTALSDADPDVRETSALSLGQLGDRGAIDPLVLALKDSGSGVRRMAAAALSRIDPEWTSAPEAQAAIVRLRASLHDCDPGARNFVGQLLVNLGEAELSAAPEGLAPEAGDISEAKRQKLAVTLFAAVLCDTDPDLRQAAAEALGQLADPRAQAALRKALADDDAGVRLAASHALQTLPAGPP